MSDSIDCSALDGGCRRPGCLVHIPCRAGAALIRIKKNFAGGGESINDDSDDPLTQQTRIDDLFRQLTPGNQAKALTYFENLKGGVNSPQACLCSPG